MRTATKCDDEGECDEEVKYDHEEIYASFKARDSVLIEQASKATNHMQSVYGVMIGVKYLHEFAHFIYSKYGRFHLLNRYGIQLKDSIHTPDGVLRGGSGNRFEEQMLGVVLSHAGHSNIAMNVSNPFYLSANEFILKNSLTLKTIIFNSNLTRMKS